MSKIKETNNLYLAMITFVSALGGFLFGYDWVVIGGAKPFYEVFFNISNSPEWIGFVMGSAILGCLFGAMFSGILADKYGRKPMLILAATIFVIASIGTGFCDNLYCFIFYRILGGVGIGIAANLSPMYIAEVSPANIRGRFVSVNQLTVVLGILAAQFINWLIADPVSPDANEGAILSSWNGQMAWRWMFWACTFPAVIFFVSIFFVPESPRWLGIKKSPERAFEIFKRIGGDIYAKNEIDSLKEITLSKKETGELKILFSRGMTFILFIGVFVAVFQQWCGINVIFNYAQEIFSAAGYGVSDILFNIVITGATNVLMTFVGMYLVDKLGRRLLILFGAFGLMVIYAALGCCYFYRIQGILMLILVVFAIGIYAMTLAPVTWVVISEIFPNRIRGLAVSISTFSLWVACFILTYTFPILNDTLGAHGTFWLYGFICAIGFVFVFKILPETKGKSLEEIEKTLTK